MKRRRFVYTMQVKGKHYILTKQQFEDSLALTLGDIDYVGGWLGITSANYEKAQKYIRDMKKPHNIGLICSYKSYRIFDENEFERYNKDNKYVIYVGNGSDL